jgi:hypothetical protein
MRAKILIPVAVAALALGAVPAAPAVTIGNGLIAALHSQAPLAEAVARKDKQRSCQAADERQRVKLPGPTVAGSTERRSATVACEQPPRSNLNIGNLKAAEASALIAAG